MLIAGLVSLREKGVDLNGFVLHKGALPPVSLREKGVDLNTYTPFIKRKRRGLPS